MKVAVRELGSVAIVDLSGRITIGRGDRELREKVRLLLDSGRDRILLNLDRVSYMDSCGVGEIAACHKEAEKRHATLKLLNPRGRVYDLLQMIRLEEVVESFRDENEALRSFC